MDCMSLLSYAACAPDPDFRARLPFAASDINRDAIPALLRRRTSQATQMAFSAAAQACLEAHRDPSKLASIFASVGGELQTTDPICVELAKHNAVISPNAFHNSVQNTAAGYWGIVQQCTQATSALAAGNDTLAMALLEAWCQLTCHGGELLLVCYDERWPTHLDPNRGDPAFASALVLAAGAVEGAIAYMGRPERGTIGFPAEWEPLIGRMPVLAAIPLLSLVAKRGESRSIPLSAAVPGCQTHLQVL